MLGGEMKDADQELRLLGGQPDILRAVAGQVEKAVQHLRIGGDR